MIKAWLFDVTRYAAAALLFYAVVTNYNIDKLL
jgi:hypothetical protein